MGEFKNASKRKKDWIDSQIFKVNRKIRAMYTYKSRQYQQ